jgi:hypothetical protein
MLYVALRVNYDRRDEFSYIVTCVTGLCVNEKVSVPSEYKRGLRQDVYYALRFGLADIDDENFAYIKDMVFNVFGKDIMAEKCPEIEPSNALPGFYIRSALLLKWKKYPELVEYIKHFFLPMAEKTGTLWEHKHNAASCDHGFASYVAIVIKACQENM